MRDTRQLQSLTPDNTIIAERLSDRATAWRIRVNRPATARFGPTSWDLLDSAGWPMEFTERVNPDDFVRVAAEQSRYAERLTFECYEVRQ